MSCDNKSVLDTILTTMGQIIGVLIIWFIVGAGWNGIYDWSCRIRGKVPSEDVGERVGKRVFYIWLLSIIGVLVLITNIESTEIGAAILVAFVQINFIFAIVTFIGLVSFFKNLK